MEPSANDVIVLLNVTIDETGTVEAAEVVEGVGAPFDTVALETVRQWRFAPARRASQPVAARVRAVVRFIPPIAFSAEPSQSPESSVAGPPARPATEPSAKPADPSSVPTETTRAKSATVPVASVAEVTIEGEAPPRSASSTRRQRNVLGAAPHHSASDLLMTVPGTFVTQHSGEGKAHQIFFRGFDARHGQDLELWVAGAPVNQVSNVHGQGYADLHFVMPEVVREIEALPGVYCPEQGDFAVAGSMLFRLGYDEPGLTARGSLGSFGTRRTFLAYHPPNQSPESFGAFEAYETDGFGMGRAAHRASGVAQWVHALSDSAKLTWMASGYAGRFGSAGVLRRDDFEAGRVDRFDSYDTQQGGHASRTQLVASLRGGRDDWSYVFAPYLVRTNLALRHNYTGYLDDPVNGDSTQQLNRATTVGVRASWRQRLTLLSKRDGITFGVAGRDDAIDQSQRQVRGTTPDVVGTSIDAAIHATNVSGYVDTALHPLRRVVVRGGLRWDSLAYQVQDEVREGGARSAQGHHLGPRLSADVVLAPGLHALASYGEGFRSPQARSLGDGERTPFTDAQSAEGGIRYREGRLQAQAATFWTRLSDDLVFLETVARNEPVPATQRVGAVVDFVAEPHSWFTSAVGFTFTRATFVESSSRYEAHSLVPFVPQVVLRADLVAHPQLAELFHRSLIGTFGVASTSVHRRPIPFGEFGSDVFLLDARASLRLTEVELGVELFNALDAEWNDGEFVYASNFEQNATASLLPTRHFTAGAPRTVLATLTLYL